MNWMSKKSGTTVQSSRMDKVIDFNQEVLHIMPRPIGMQDPHEAALSYTQLIEEAREYQEAIGRVNFVECIDAVLDGLYFSYGILYKMGLTEQMVDEMFDAIHQTNMAKAKGIKPGREGFKAADATKPTGWVDPKVRMEEILNAYITKNDNT